MKSPRILLSTLLLGAMIGVAAARAADDQAPGQNRDRRGGGRARPTPEQMVSRIDQAVGGLTAEQKAKIQEIYAQLQDVPREERQAKMVETHQKVRALLTAEQQKKFDEMAPQGPGRGRNPDGSARQKKDP